MTDGCHLIDLQLLPDDQFRLRFGKECRTGSLYYFGIDPHSVEHNRSAEKNLAVLIKRWIVLLLEQPIGRPLFLPFDFADECTRWLACEKKETSEIIVVSGWAPVEGWAIGPSDFRDYAQSLPGFQADEPFRSQIFYLPRILAEFRRVVGQLTACRSPQISTPQQLA